MICDDGGRRRNDYRSKGSQGVRVIAIGTADRIPGNFGGDRFVAGVGREEIGRSCIDG